MTATNLADEVKGDEGLRLIVYDDATKKPILPGTTVIGHPTIGYGRCLDREGITKEEAEYLLANDISRVKIELAKALPWITTLNEPRQAVLQNMAFNMGIGTPGKSGLLAFTKTLDFIQRGQYSAAATAMLESKWANQVGARATRLSLQMDSGEWR